MTLACPTRLPTRAFNSSNLFLFNFLSFNQLRGSGSVPLPNAPFPESSALHELVHMQRFSLPVRFCPHAASLPRNDPDDFSVFCSILGCQSGDEGVLGRPAGMVGRFISESFIPPPPSPGACSLFSLFFLLLLSNPVNSCHCSIPLFPNRIDRY